MEAEARQNRMEIVVDFWMFPTEHGDFADIKERSRNGEELSGVELQRIDSEVMATFVCSSGHFGNYQQLQQR